MDVLLLARLQFALTIMFHYIFPLLSIGLGLMLVLVEGAYLKTGKLVYLQMAQLWTKIFALTFAMGVATGIVMEFEFGTNWSAYSRYVGDVFGSALAAEGVFAFFLESGFLAIMLFGWNRVSPKWHFFSTVMVALGAHFSSVWIVVANSWMQTPAGYHLVETEFGLRAEITDFWQMVLNPSSVARLLHVIFGCWMAGAFLVVSIGAFYLLKNRWREFAEKSIALGLFVAIVTSFLQLVTGDWSGKIVAQYQPAKLAALEAHYHTEKEAPLTLFGIVNASEGRVEYAWKIPRLLSFLAKGDPQAEVLGLDKVPKNDRPHVAPLFYVYRIMLGMWAWMLALSLIGLYAYWKGRLLQKRWVLYALSFSVLAPQIANQAGWYCAEVGRYPWLVYGLLRTSDGLSKAVTSSQIMGSILMFLIVYFVLFLLFLYLLNEKIRAGPEEVREDQTTPYHGLQHFLEEKFP